MKEPLGRIHPHGRNGKSVYQRAGEEANDVVGGFFSLIFRCLGFALLGICAVGFLVALASGESLEIGGVGMIILGAAAALIND